MRQSQLLLIVGIYTFAASMAFADKIPGFPKGPDAQMTPGALCTDPSSHRYPENIPYCDRDVEAKEKWVIIRQYEQKYDFNVDDNNRDEFKIDHYIPLCMGGGNDITNLWPQNKSIYTITDPLEELLCEVLSDGKLKQAEVIQKMRDAKANLSLVPDMMKQLQALKDAH